MDAIDLLCGEAPPLELLDPLGMGAPASHGADVAGRFSEDPLQHRILEAGVVAQQHHVGAPIDLDLILDVVGPAHQHPIGLGKPLGGGEGGAGVGDHHPEPELLGHGGERFGHLVGAEDQELGLGGHRLDEHLALSIAEGPRLFVLGQLAGVGQHVVGHFGRQLPGDVALVEIDDRPGPDVRSGDHRGERPEPLLVDQPLEGFDHHFSMNT